MPNIFSLTYPDTDELPSIVMNVGDTSAMLIAWALQPLLGNHAQHDQAVADAFLHLPIILMDTRSNHARTSRGGDSRS